MWVTVVDIRKIKKQVADHFGEEKMAARQEGNPNQTRYSRESGRAGRNPTPDELPTQDTTDRQGKEVKGNVVQGEFIPSTDTTLGVYRLGAATRPNIRHDSGHANFPKEDPTWSDRLALLKWYGMLEGGEALRPDLTDGLGAYRHFLEGEGRARTFSYERYVTNDNSGRTTFRNVILEAQDAAIKLWQEHQRPSFSFTGPAIPCGGSLFEFPYPETENWAKAIGAHSIWLSGRVSVNKPTTGEPTFTMALTIHAEDQYNFNPGANDIATGISDDANGRFVIVGWAHGYRNSAEMHKQFSWTGTELGVASMGIRPIGRTRQPSNNRRARNRL